MANNTQIQINSKIYFALRWHVNIKGKKKKLLDTY